MSLRPTALATGKTGMYVVIDDPDTERPLLIPCSWEHRSLDVSRDDLASGHFEIHPARSSEADQMRSNLDVVEPIFEALQKLLAAAQYAQPSVAQLAKAPLAEAIERAGKALELLEPPEAAALLRKHQERNDG